MANYPDHCLVGLHNVADGAAQPADLEAARVARIEAVKTMTANPPEDVDKFRAALGLDILIVVRLYLGGLGDRTVSGAQAGRDWIADIERFWSRGMRHFEIHNEPNLRQEGMWRNWQNGREFATWWLDAAGMLRARFPGIQLGWPGLSPGGDVANVRYRSDWFLKEAKAALEAADWVGAHCYEVFNATDRGAGGAWRDVRDAANGKPLAITEFSSPQQSPATQARQYRAFYEALRHEPTVFAAFCFCVYGNHFQHEAWRTQAGQQLPHAAEVARRQFKPPTPQPTEPAGIVWLPEPHAAVFVDDKYGGAVIRDYAGREFKRVLPGTELARRSKPYTFPNLPATEGRNRVLVNRQLGLHVLADRLITPVVVPPAPAAVFTWPTEFRVVTQAWGARPEYYGQWQLAGHEGLDIRAPLGSKVFAAYHGTVKEVRSGGNYGNQIRLAHVIDGRNVTTVYAHLQEALVREGETVAGGQVIGLADSTGNSDASHLHFGVKVEGEAPSGFAGFQNPAPWLGLPR